MPNTNPSVEPDIVTKTMENVERLERKMTLENLNRLLDEVNLNPIKAQMYGQ